MTRDIAKGRRTTVDAVRRDMGQRHVLRAAAGISGYYAAPGSKNAYGLAYTLSSASDYGKCTIAYVPM